ncbi:MAG TPA: TetR/AcrR family transcriptional regulator [Methanocella sp.]
MAEDITDKKAAIMRAALILFTQRGFHGTPTSMISESAGVSTGTLFRCFETKNDLIDSVYFSAKERLSLATYAGCEQEKNVRNKIRHIWGNTIRWGVENPYEFLFIEQFGSSPFITDVTQEQALKNFSFLFELLNDGVRDRVLKDLDRSLALEMLYSANVAVVKKLIQTGDTKDLDGTIDRSFDIVWSGIARK